MSRRIEHAPSGTAVGAFLVAIGMALDFFIGRSVPGMPWWPNLSVIAFALVLLAVMLTGPRSKRFSAVAFVILNAVMVGALWVTNGRYARLVPTWIAFRPHHIGTLAAALLAPPPLWSGILSVTIIMVAAVAQFLLFSQELRDRQVGEPLVILIYGVFALVLLVHRWQRTASEQARVAAQGRAVAMEQIARGFLALRDLANTPLQTIALSTMMLRQQHPELAPVADRIDRALAQLREGTRVMSRYDEYLRWDARATSFDPVEMLEKSAHAGEIAKVRLKPRLS